MTNKTRERSQQHEPDEEALAKAISVPFITITWTRQGCIYESDKYAIRHLPWARQGCVGVGEHDFTTWDRQGCIDEHDMPVHAADTIMEIILYWFTVGVHWNRNAAHIPHPPLQCWWPMHIHIQVRAKLLSSTLKRGCGLSCNRFAGHYWFVMTASTHSCKR